MKMREWSGRMTPGDCLTGTYPQASAVSGLTVCISLVRRIFQNTDNRILADCLLSTAIDEGLDMIAINFSWNARMSPEFFDPRYGREREAY